MNQVAISVVIATRNRFNHLCSTLRSIESQTFLPNEIIIVDSSDDPDFNKQHIRNSLTIRWLYSKPSVCAQRNLGVKSAESDWIFICDDDIELDADYFEKLIDYVRINNSCGAAAGKLLQNENQEWVKNYPVKSFSDLFWRFVFQHSIWGNIQINSRLFFKPLERIIIEFYRRRANTLSLAGWPLITQWNDPVIRTQFYSLGASLIRKDWLLKSPFDELLEPHGIGDNYGVAKNFPRELAIHIITSTAAYHHRAEENRIDQGQVRFLRIIALHYFLWKKKSAKITKIFFIWSVFGHCLYSLFKVRKNYGQLFRALAVVVLDNNPYLKQTKPQHDHPNG